MAMPSAACTIVAESQRRGSDDAVWPFIAKPSRKPIAMKPQSIRKGASRVSAGSSKRALALRAGVIPREPRPCAGHRGWARAEQDTPTRSLVSPSFMTAIPRKPRATNSKRKPSSDSTSALYSAHQWPGPDGWFGCPRSQFHPAALSGRRPKRQSGFPEGA
jgi:hypothetical protein